MFVKYYKQGDKYTISAKSKCAVIILSLCKDAFYDICSITSVKNGTTPKSLGI